MSKIFLSHTNVDKPFVRRLAADLRKYGHTVWIDEAEINIGDSLIEKIREGLDSVDYVAVVLSKASINSVWVQREIDIASNREIRNEIKILPIKIEDVALPGFLEGKLYADFSDEYLYGDKLELLLRSLGDSKSIISFSENESEALQEQLKEMKKAIEKQKREKEKIIQHTLLSKSPELRKAIEEANKSNPDHAPINNVYAFQLSDGLSVTLGYLLWAYATSKFRGGHPLELLLTFDKKWDEVERMLEAYSEMLKED